MNHSRGRHHGPNRLPSSSRRNQKRIFRYLVVFLVLFSLGVVYASGEIARRREAQKQLYRQNRRRVDALCTLFAEQLIRHPDVELPEARAFFKRFRILTEQEQVKNLGPLESAYRELTRLTRQAILGTDQGPADTGGPIGYKTFSPNGFKNFWDSLEQPGTRKLGQSPSITGDVPADRQIILLAEERGYRLRSEADEEKLVSLGRHHLHPAVLESWLKLREAARAEGIHLGLISAYRSVERQRQIFLRLLRQESLRQGGRGFTNDEIAAGLADGIIDEILRSSSIPGYSKHHSGYAMDITDLGSQRPFTEFSHSKGFAWMAGSNYRNAKRFGFLPSYPLGATGQGPEPEAWEYVWVGEELLQEEANP